MTSLYDLLWKMLMVDQVDVDKVAWVIILTWVMWHDRNEARLGA